jgi:starch synthase (maltosyl-transferring)
MLQPKLDQRPEQAMPPPVGTAGRQRVVIEGVSPEIDGGRFPIKRVPGEEVVIEADIFADGHDAVSAVLLFRRQHDPGWSEAPFIPLGNDRWRASFVVATMENYQYTLLGWVDHFKSWLRDLEKRLEAGQDIAVDRLIGAALLEQASDRATGADCQALLLFAQDLRDLDTPIDEALTPECVELALRHADRCFATRYGKELGVTVEPVKARFSAWYELFPRSWSQEPGRHGTFRDVEAQLGYVAGMGFDVLYLPPIHPIGQTFRKGPNNNVVSQPCDLGSPWAIGGPEGGHTAIHPELGTLEDFRALVQSARGYGIDIALDIAFQCSPDHPWVTEHPEWFKRRPDGTIQYAENPPKKYQDIYPFNFETEEWPALWSGLLEVFLHWCEHGVRVYRVDNPHTKPLPFWEWLIGEVKRGYPETIFLSEAFTRPRVLEYLAKAGFSQSYNYFPWRNTKAELTEYLTELTTTGVREYLRPNLWPNTPDILTEHFQVGGRPAFISRFVLASTLGASYGIYGPAFELQENRPVAPGKEEYLDSEKYQIRRWERDHPESLRPLITVVNQVRREHPALQSNDRLCFHPVDNDQLIAYSKTTEDGSDRILVVVNLDPHFEQAGWVDLRLDELGIAADELYQVHDLLNGRRYIWRGARNYVALRPWETPAHVFTIQQRLHSERDFDYFD